MPLELCHYVPLAEKNNKTKIVSEFSIFVEGERYTVVRRTLNRGPDIVHFKSFGSALEFVGKKMQTEEERYDVVFSPENGTIPSLARSGVR